MKMIKAIRKQAGAAERAAFHATDPLVAEEMKTLALAFRAQADALKKKKKKKGRYDVYCQRYVPARRTRAPQEHL